LSALRPRLQPHPPKVTILAVAQYGRTVAN